MTQAQLAARAGISQGWVSAAEAGDPDVALEVRCRLTAACGYELGWRLFPVASVPLRDSGQLEIAQAIIVALHASWQPRMEAPVGPGDARAVDLLVTRSDELAAIEIERTLVDVQAQVRSVQLKRNEIVKREERPVRLVLALPETRAVRERIAFFGELLDRQFPVPSRRIWRALRTGEPIEGDGILFVRARRSQQLVISSSDR